MLSGFPLSMMYGRQLKKALPPRPWLMFPRECRAFLHYTTAVTNSSAVNTDYKEVPYCMSSSSTGNLQQSIRNQTIASMNLAKHVLTKEYKNSNVVFSPMAINVLLSLIAAGSDGQTLNQLLSFLKAGSIDELNSFSYELVTRIFADGNPMGGPKLSFANGVWIDQSLSFKPCFKQVADDVYKSTLQQVDFRRKHAEVLKEVNSWVEKETNSLIKEILSAGSVDNLTRLIFANALYFKGAWTKKFNSSMTKDHEFHLLNGSSVQTPFMTNMNNQYIISFDGFKVLRLPYKQGDQDDRCFSMYVFLPDAKDGLSSLVEKIGSESGFIDRHIPFRKLAVRNFLIPKFRISFWFEASKILQGLGVGLPFYGDLTKIANSSEGEELFVSGIIHKSFIEVNEEGTEAAAVSASRAYGRARTKPQTIDFVADHPFIFLIREDMTGVVPFIGQVLNPLEVD